MPITHADYGVDWETMRTIVVDRAYDLDYRDAVVVDVGAHKGCYGAFALAEGARAVVSFEPEETNFAHLERCAAACRKAGRDWRTRRAAVGDAAGTADLHVLSASWGHALAPAAESAPDEVGAQRVPVEAMEDVLAEAAEVAGESPLVVKVNAEGAECDIVLGTPLSAWRSVRDVLAEVHSWAPCTAAELAEHLSGAGLAVAPPGGAHWVHRLSRVATF